MNRPRTYLRSWQKLQSFSTWELLFLGCVLVLAAVVVTPSPFPFAHAYAPGSDNINNIPHHRHNLPSPIEVWCEGMSVPSAASYTVTAADSTHRTLFTRACSYSDGITIGTTDLAVPITNALIYVIDAKLTGTLTVNANLGGGSYLTIINLQRIDATTALLPIVALLGALSTGAELTISGGTMGAVSISQAVSQCAKLSIVGAALTQLSLSTSSSFTASATFALQRSTITTEPDMAHGFSMAGVLVDSLFEVSGTTIAGDQQAAVSFDSRSTLGNALQGTNNVINITGNTLSLRATTATLNSDTAMPSQYVLAFLDPPAVPGSVGSYLRPRTLLTLAGNTFTYPGGALNVPLIYCYSYGALVVHDGSNNGTGGRLHFIAGGTSTTTAVLGSQLVLRTYTGLLSIIVAHVVPLTNPTVLVESCTMDTFQQTGDPAVAGYNVMLASSNTVSFTVDIGGTYTLDTNSSVVIQGITVQSLTVSYSKISGGVLEVQSCNVLGIAWTFPIEASATVMVRDTTMTASGFSFSGSISGSSILHVEGNTITHTSSDAVTFSSACSGQSTISFVSNNLTCSASPTVYAFKISGVNTGARVYLTNNDANSGSYNGGFYLSDVWSGTNTYLVMVGNLFRPSIATSSYIFYVANWAQNARFIHDSTNRYYGSRPFSFAFNNQGGTAVTQSLNVYLHVMSSTLSTFSFTGMSTTVQQDYGGSIVALTSTTVTGAATVNLQFTKDLSVMFKSSNVGGALTLTCASTYNTSFLYRSGTITGGASVAGTFNGLTSVAFDSATIPIGKRIDVPFSSNCPSSTATCLFALWTTNIGDTSSNSNRIAVDFTGALSGYTHIDIYRSRLSTYTSGAFDTVRFTQGTQTGAVSLSIDESQLTCRDSNIFQDFSYALNMDTPMTGGIEMWGSAFDGDGIKATWSSGSMAYIHAFKNRIEEGYFMGSALSLSTSVQACNWCDVTGCSLTSGGTITTISELDCSGTRRRCIMTSNFRKASYDATINSVYPGSCILLPDIVTRLAVVIPSSSFKGTNYTYAVMTGGMFDATVSTFTCDQRRDRLASIRTLVSSSSNAAMWASVITCSGQPAATYTPVVTFAAIYTTPSTRVPRWCNNSLEKSLSWSRTLSSTESLLQPATASLTTTVTLVHPTSTVLTDSLSPFVSRTIPIHTSSTSASASLTSAQTTAITHSETIPIATVTSAESPSRISSAPLDSSSPSPDGQPITASQTVTAPPPIHPIPKYVDPRYNATITVVNTVGTVVVVGSGLTVPLAGVMQSASTALLRMLQCEEDALSGEPLDLLVHPLSFAVGRGRYAYGRGAIIGNLIVAPAVWALLAWLIIPLCVQFVMNSGGPQEGSNHPPFTLQQARGYAGWPGSMSAPIALLAEGSAMACVALLSGDGNNDADDSDDENNSSSNGSGALAGDIALGAFAAVMLLWTAAMWAVTLWRMQRMKRLGPSQTEQPKGQEWQQQGSPTLPLLQCIRAEAFNNNSGSGPSQSEAKSEDDTEKDGGWCERSVMPLFLPRWEWVLRSHGYSVGDEWAPNLKHISSASLLSSGVVDRGDDGASGGGDDDAFVPLLGMLPPSCEPTSLTLGSGSSSDSSTFISETPSVAGNVAARAVVCDNGADIPLLEISMSDVNLPDVMSNSRDGDNVAAHAHTPPTSTSAANTSTAALAHSGPPATATAPLEAFIDQRLELVGDSWWLWSSFAAHCFSLLLGAAEGMPGHTTSLCQSRWALAMIAAIGQSAATLTNTIPFQLVLLGLFAVINGLLIIFIAITVFGISGAYSEHIDDAANVVGMMGALVGLVMTVVGLVGSLLELLRKWRKRRKNVNPPVSANSQKIAVSSAQKQSPAAAAIELPENNASMHVPPWEPLSVSVEDVDGVADVRSPLPDANISVVAADNFSLDVSDFSDTFATSNRNNTMNTSANANNNNNRLASMATTALHTDDDAFQQTNSHWLRILDDAQEASDRAWCDMRLRQLS